MSIFYMEEAMGHPFFCCDAVLDSKSRQIAIFSGYAKEMMPLSWKVADRRRWRYMRTAGAYIKD